MEHLTKTLTGALLLPALTLATALPALAQTASLPAYAHPGDAVIRGVVRSVDGKYTITVRDANGYVDNVTLHEGTIINPTGLTLAPGESVTIDGQPSGSTFIANEIDTPYSAYGARYGYGYPYPAFIGFGYGRFGFRGRF